MTADVHVCEECQLNHYVTASVIYSVCLSQFGNSITSSVNLI